MVEREREREQEREQELEQEREREQELEQEREREHMISHNRKIYLIGDIDHDAYKKFTRRLAFLEDSGDEEIHIVLSSNGGDGQVALAFYDCIRLSPCPISITGTGLIASAAALILVAPPDVSLRTMTTSAWLMVHDDQVQEEVTSMRVSQADKYLHQLKKYESQWNSLMEKSTNTMSTTWQYLHENESFLTAEECVKMGVIGGII